MFKNLKIQSDFSRKGLNNANFWASPFATSIAESERGAYSRLIESPSHSTWAYYLAFISNLKINLKAA
jgi:hypothetical protein